MQQLSNLFLLVVLLVTSLSTTLNAAALKKGKTYIIVTSAGRVYAGTLIKETKTSVVLKLTKSKKEPVTILKADIEEIREAKKQSQPNTALSRSVRHPCRIALPVGGRARTK